MPKLISPDSERGFVLVVLNSCARRLTIERIKYLSLGLEGPADIQERGDAVLRLTELNRRRTVHITSRRELNLSRRDVRNAEDFGYRLDHAQREVVIEEWLRLTRAVNAEVSGRAISRPLGITASHNCHICECEACIRAFERRREPSIGTME